MRTRIKFILLVLSLSLAGPFMEEATGTPVTAIYEFLPDQSNLAVSGGFAPTLKNYQVEGQFWLTIDLTEGIASFNQVDATISEAIWYQSGRGEPPRLTQNLNTIFQMTELESTYVNNAQIDFLLEIECPFWGNYDIELRLSFIEEMVNLTGGFSLPMPDSYQYRLVGFAIPEPATLFFLGLGGLIIRKQICRKRTP